MKETNDYMAMSLQLVAETCRSSFFYFVKTFWSVIIKEEAIYNWHIEYLCDELQILSKSIVERKEKPYDLVVNIPPGTTKSTITTIMFPAWLWTQDPSLRIITNSYSMDLSIEHATKSRDIIMSDKFRKLFPNVSLRRDKSAKSSYENTNTGARYTTSTGGTITGKHAHCLTGETNVITINGEKKMQDLSVDDIVLSYFNGKFEFNKIVATQKLKTNEIYRITINGRTIEATADHRFFTEKYGYVEARNLQKGDCLLEAETMHNLRKIVSTQKCKNTTLQSNLCKRKTLKQNGKERKSTFQKWRKLCKTIRRNEIDCGKTRQWNLCFMRKIFRRLSSYKFKYKRQSFREFDNAVSHLPQATAFKAHKAVITNIERISNKSHIVYDIQVEKAHNFFAEKILTHNCIINDDPLNPSQAASDADRDTANEHTKTLASRKVDKRNTPTITIMQRLHELDVTGYLLNKKSDKIKHICLPAEVTDNIKPAELRSRYIGGLLDPSRLSKDVLAEQLTDLGSRGYSGQYEQNPVAAGGNIIKKEWFQYIHRSDFERMHRNEPIIFFADTAYTDKKENDPTGLIASCRIGNDLYITNAKKVLMKFPELIKFLPQYVQANSYTNMSSIRIEPKANGLSVIDQLKIDTKLNVTKTPTPTESKETRLNSKSPIVECGRVILVSGAWNEEFTDEICGFPAKAHDEYVDLLCYAIDFHLKAKKPINTSILNKHLY